MKFLQPLEDFASNSLETHHLGFEVYYRRSKTRNVSHRIEFYSYSILEKYLLMLRCLKRMKKLDPTDAKLHSSLMKFLRLGFNLIEQ